MFRSVGFIGTGNMGSAVAKAVYQSGAFEKLLLSNRTVSKAEALAAELPGAIVTTNEEIASTCDLLFLGVKPYAVMDVLTALKPLLYARRDRFVLCSMAAAVSCEDLCGIAGAPVIRIMPNTPVAVGAGVTEYCSLGVTEEELADFRALMAKSGVVDPLDEKLMDAASSVSGCGPAFAYLFAEALSDGGVACGLPRDKSLLYAAGMLEGAARLLRETGKHPGELKDAVCSPGGTTIEGIRVLEESGFRGAAMNAVIAAYEKTLRLK